MKLEQIYKTDKERTGSFADLVTGNYASTTALSIASLGTIFSKNSKEISNSVYALTNDEFISKNSLRVSFSYLTNKEEIDIFVSSLKEIVDSLA